MTTLRALVPLPEPTPTVPASQSLDWPLQHSKHGPSLPFPVTATIAHFSCFPPLARLCTQSTPHSPGPLEALQPLCLRSLQLSDLPLLQSLCQPFQVPQDSAQHFFVLHITNQLWCWLLLYQETVPNPVPCDLGGGLHNTKQDPPRTALHWNPGQVRHTMVKSDSLDLGVPGQLKERAWLGQRWEKRASWQG